MVWYTLNMNMLAHPGIAFLRLLVAPAVIVTLLFVGFLGLSHAAVGEHHGEAAIQDCFVPGVAVCAMGPIEHVERWQDLFVAVVPFNDAALAALALLIFFAAQIFVLLYMYALYLPLAKVHAFFTYMARRVFVARQLHDAFSNGVLHAKVFSRAL